MVRRPASRRLASVASPSRVRSALRPISRRYIRTGSSVRPRSSSPILGAAVAGFSSGRFSTASAASSPSVTAMPISDSTVIVSSIRSAPASPGGRAPVSSSWATSLRSRPRAIIPPTGAVGRSRIGPSAVSSSLSSVWLHSTGFSDITSNSSHGLAPRRLDDEPTAAPSDHIASRRDRQSALLDEGPACVDDQCCNLICPRRRRQRRKPFGEDLTLDYPETADFLAPRQSSSQSGHSSACSRGPSFDDQADVSRAILPVTPAADVTRASSRRFPRASTPRSGRWRSATGRPRPEPSPPLANRDGQSDRGGDCRNDQEQGPSIRAGAFQGGCFGEPHGYSVLVW